MIFSLDASIAFLIILFACAGFAIAISSNAARSAEMMGEYELEETALLIADSLIKNHNAENPLLGACKYNSGTRIVESNNLFLQDLRNAKQIDNNEIFVKEIIVKSGSVNETIALKNGNFSECFAVKRYALIDGQKGSVAVNACKK